MWQALKNFATSLITYPALSPDLKIRRQVNRQLQSRPSLTLEEWYQRWWQPLEAADQASRPVVAFVYTHLPNYSGLDWSRVRPDDQLVADLRLPLVCWFDWSLQLCEDVYQEFHIDISLTFDEAGYRSVRDLVMFLHSELHLCRD